MNVNVEICCKNGSNSNSGAGDTLQKKIELKLKILRK